MKKKRFNLELVLLLIHLYIGVLAQCPSGNNKFTGKIDDNWNNELNWSERCIPLSPISGTLSIEANCKYNGAIAYIFNEGSSLQIKKDVTFTNMTTVSWVMNGTVNGEGLYRGNITISGFLKPGYIELLPTNTTDSINYGGQIYSTKLMPDGNWWMAENLNIGQIITVGANMTNNNKIEKHCYANLASNCATFGGLYQWKEMMNYSSTQASQGICPDGWHIPTENEYLSLINSLQTTHKGSSLSGQSGLWWSGNLIKSLYFGSSGFGMLPGGYSQDNGTSAQSPLQSELWTSTEGYSSEARKIVTAWTDTGVFISTSSKSVGRNIRCIKN